MSGIESLRAIAVFLKVVEEGSLTAAAHALGTSTSAVSATMARLERKLTVRLLDRTTRRLSVTAEGEEYYRRCKKIMTDLRSAELAVSGISRIPAGPLRVSIPAALCRNWVLPRLPEFVTEYPGIELEFVLTDFVPYTMEEGLDMAVQIGELQNSQLAVRTLAKSRYVICAAPSYLAARGVPSSLHDLKTHSCLAYRRPRDGRLWEWKVNLDGERRRIAVPATMIFNSNEALASAAAVGLGIANLAEYYALPYLEEGRLQRVLPESSCEGYTISVVFPESRRDYPRQRAFVEFLSRTLRNTPWNCA